MDAKPRELYLLFRAYEGYEGSLLKVTSKNGKTASVSWLNLTWHWELLILTPSLLYSIARWVCHIQHESRRWSSKTRFTGEPRQTPTHPNSFLPLFVLLSISIALSHEPTIMTISLSVSTQIVFPFLHHIFHVLKRLTCVVITSRISRLLSPLLDDAEHIIPWFKSIIPRLSFASFVPHSSRRCLLHATTLVAIMCINVR